MTRRDALSDALHWEEARFICVAWRGVAGTRFAFIVARCVASVEVQGQGTAGQGRAGQAGLFGGQGRREGTLSRAKSGKEGPSYLPFPFHHNHQRYPPYTLPA